MKKRKRKQSKWSKWWLEHEKASQLLANKHKPFTPRTVAEAERHSLKVIACAIAEGIREEGFDESRDQIHMMVDKGGAQFCVELGKCLSSKKKPSKNDEIEGSMALILVRNPDIQVPAIIEELKQLGFRYDEIPNKVALRKRKDRLLDFMPKDQGVTSS